jgi:hypothetical protein
MEWGLIVRRATSLGAFKKAVATVPVRPNYNQRLLATASVY